MKRHYTQNEYKQLLSNMRIVCQSNEQKNDHIKKYFTDNGIEYVERSIPEGDYSFMIKSCPELGFNGDYLFLDELFIERKNSLQELAGSLYGQKEMPAYAKRVVEELKKEKVYSPYQTATVIRDIKSQFSVYDDAFSRELKRAINKPHKFLLVEQPNGWKGIADHDYPNNYSEKAFWGAVHSLEVKYGLHVKFIDKKQMGLEIYTICKYVLNSCIDR